jgi:hypothetical protein
MPKIHSGRPQFLARSARSGQCDHQTGRPHLLGTGRPNWGHFESPETEALIGRIFSEFDGEKRLSLLTEMHEQEGR